MQTLTLALVSAAGDELAQIPLADCAVAGPDEAPTTDRPDLRSEIGDLCHAVCQAVAREGMVVGAEHAQLRLILCEALLAEDAELLIRLPVRHLEPGVPAEGADPDAAGSDAASPLLTGLFDTADSGEAAAGDDGDD